MVTTLDELRLLTVTRNLFNVTTLKRALDRLGFVQADPIRAPARAQDLVLRHRVKGYRAGDLERRYTELDVHEDYFVNYGFVTGSLRQLMHPRTIPAKSGRAWTAAESRQARRVMEFVRDRKEVHPKEVEARFSQGTIINYWGGSSNATTRLLDEMHYRGMLDVVRRESGIRIYTPGTLAAAAADAAMRHARLDSLVDAAVGIYAPLPGASLSSLVRRLRYGAPQWSGELAGAVRRARERLEHARVDGIDWYWPAEWDAAPRPAVDEVRLLAPFDPVVWDRDRFELLWGWTYRFEGYTPASRRTRGYYALPLLWRDRVIGWGNLSVTDGTLEAEIGYVTTKPRSRTFTLELEAELDRIRVFLGLPLQA
jgi:hypothetical protein